VACEAPSLRTRDRAREDTGRASARVAAIDSGEVNWTIVPGPGPGVAQRLFGEPDVERLWRLVAPLLRLDAGDAAAAWREHAERLNRRAAELPQRRFRQLRFGRRRILAGTTIAGDVITVRA
jgi:leucyl aminopeptidase (aminopeptidase T)